jgi:hypothetical protein
LMLVPREAFADDAEERKAKAKKLFDAGSAAIAKGDKQAGCDLMRESLELFVVANSMFQVSMCDEREKKFASALAHWKRGLALVDKGDPRTRVAARTIAALEKRVPRIKVLVPSRVSPVVVLIDDEEIATEELANPVPVDPGNRIITIRKQGHQDKRFDVALDEGQRTEVMVDVGPPLPSKEPEKRRIDEPPPQNGRGFRTAGFVALGVGVVGVAGVAVTSGLIVSNDNVIDEKCANKMCDMDTLNIVEKQRSLLPVNAAMWAVAGVGAAGAALFFVMDARSAKPNTSTVGIFPLPLAGGGGIGLSGRF